LSKRIFNNAYLNIAPSSFTKSKFEDPLLAVKILKALKDLGVKAELCMVGPDSDGSLERAKQL